MEYRVEDIHDHLPIGFQKKCQFCNNAATIVISDLTKTPTFWMCDEHALHFAEGIVRDIGGTADLVVASVKKQEDRKRTEKTAEKRALHVD